MLLSARNQWAGRVESSNYFYGPAANRTLRCFPSAPMSSDPIQNLTLFLVRSVYVLGFTVNSKEAPGHGFIASASYNDQLLPGLSTGAPETIWWYTTTPPRPGWDTQVSFNMTGWSRADTTSRCSNGTAPAENSDGYNYADVISENGINPGNVRSSWVGASPDCDSQPPRVFYRALVNLTSMVPEPVCLPPTDARSVLQTNPPLIQFDVGKPIPGETRELSVTATADDEFLIYVNGRMAAGDNGWSRLQTFRYHIRPPCTQQVLVAFYARNFISWTIPINYRGFIGVVRLDGNVVDVTGSESGNWMVSPAGTYPPPPGWNTDLAFNTTAHNWTATPIPVDPKCANTWGRNFIQYLNGTTGGMLPQWIWNTDCIGLSNAHDMYVRLIVNVTGASDSWCADPNAKVASFSTEEQNTWIATSSHPTMEMETQTPVTTYTNMPKQSLAVSTLMGNLKSPKMTPTGKPGGGETTTESPTPGSVAQIVLVVAVAAGTGFGIVLLGLLALFAVRRTFRGPRAPPLQANMLSSHATLPTNLNQNNHSRHQNNMLASNGTLAGAHRMASNASLRAGNSPAMAARQTQGMRPTVPLKYTTPMAMRFTPQYAHLSRPTLMNSTEYLERTPSSVPQLSQRQQPPQQQLQQQLESENW